MLQIVESTVDMVDLAKTTERALKSIKRHTSSGTNDNFWSEVLPLTILTYCISVFLSVEYVYALSRGHTPAFTETVTLELT